MQETQEVQQSDSSVAVATEVKPEVTTVGKKKGAEKTGNLILDIAHEVEQMSKAKALNEADRLAENIEVNYFKMGGVLKLINDNSWFEGFASFDDFVTQRYGFQSRKARYLIMIYDNLVMKQIPWDKVAHLGWTKLKDLAPVLTLENLDEWVAKAQNLTVIELQALLKAGTEGKGETTAATTDEVVKMNFKFKPDQADVVQQAIAKAKGELKTDYDTVAVENICAAYLGDTVSIKVTDNVQQFVEQIGGFMKTMEKISELFPEYDIAVSAAGGTAPAQEEQAQEATQ